MSLQPKTQETIVYGIKALTVAEKYFFLTIQQWARSVMLVHSNYDYLLQLYVMLVVLLSSH